MNEMGCDEQGGRWVVLLLLRAAANRLKGSETKDRKAGRAGRQKIIG